MLAARLLGRETRFELPERARVVLHSLNHYRLGLLESRTYPHWSKCSASPAPRVVAAAGGPRYDATLSSDRRRDHSNGIWLTQPHIQVLLRFREPECPVLRPRSTAVARQAAPLSPSAQRRAYESARPETVYGPERAPRL